MQKLSVYSLYLSGRVERSQDVHVFDSAEVVPEHRHVIVLPPTQKHTEMCDVLWCEEKQFDTEPMCFWGYDVRYEIRY